MPKFDRALQAWNSDSFAQVFAQQVAQLPPAQLPLQHALSQGNYPSDRPVTVTILKVSDEPATLRVKAGLFFTSLIAGCQCADDPSSPDELNEYCEVEFAIAKDSALTHINLLQN